MRLMFLGDRIVGGTSAYTKVGFETCTRLAELGHSVAHIPMGRVNLMGKQGLGKVLLYPSGHDYFCEDVAVQHYVDFKADMLVTIKEPWVFNEIFKWAINFVPMAIIDHEPVSPAITSRLTTAFKVIAISRFGQLELRRKNIDSTFIPHGIRCDVYKPLDKVECKKLFHLDPEAYVIGIVCMNRVRKMIPRMLRGCKRFQELNPDVKMEVMLWTNIQPRSTPEDVTTGVSDVGVNLLPEIVDLKQDKVIHWPKWDQFASIGGLPEWDASGGWDMVKLYNAFDVNLLCSGGEGAGLTYLESAATGIYSVGTDYAGAPEYVGPGLIVPWSDYDILNTPGTRYAFADIDKMAEALTKVMNGNPEKMAKKARRHAERFDWKKIITDYWVPFLEKCALELRPKWTKDGLTTWN